MNLTMKIQVYLKMNKYTKMKQKFIKKDILKKYFTVK